MEIRKSRLMSNLEENLENVEGLVAMSTQCSRTCCSLSQPAEHAPSNSEGLPVFRTLPEHSVGPQR